MGKRKTHDQFVKEVYEITRGEYEVIGKYVNSNTKLEVFHTKCSNSYEVPPSRFLRGDRCPYCNGNKKKTHQEFVQEVYELVEDEYSVLGEYINANTKIKMIHDICDHIYYTTPAKFINRKQRCPNCNKYKEKTLEDYLEIIKQDKNDEYELVGEFINMNSRTIFKHKPCGYHWDISPSRLINYDCPKCSGNIRKKDTDFFKQEVYELVNNEYTVLGEYVPQSKILMRHNACNHEWEVYTASFLSGTRCPKCNGGVRKTHEQFKEEVYNLVENEYEILDEYIANNVRIPILHKKCTQISMICPIDFLEGVRCLFCNSSRGEKKIYTYLNNRGFIFREQYKFKDCKYKRSLPFDFAVFDNNDRLYCLIEYDGKQHFEPIDAFNGKEGYMETKRNDKIKNTYCEQNNIKLIRIPYWDFDRMEEILNKELI